MQEAELRTRPDIVIATPGRLVDHIQNTHSFDLSTVEVGVYCLLQFHKMRLPPCILESFPTLSFYFSLIFSHPPPPPFNPFTRF